MPIPTNKPRTKAEKSLDGLNERLAQLLGKRGGLTHAEREEMQDVQRRLTAARRSVRQMREGTR